MLPENTTTYRNTIYTYLESHLPSGIKETDLDMFVELIAYIFGDLYEQASLLPWEIDVDNCSIDNLKHLSSLIKYPWNNALTEEEQRQTIKYYTLLRRNRGTNFALINLIKLFGKDADTYYSNTSHAGVRIVEYDPDVEHIYELFPGDIRIEVPELSTIMREAVNDVKLMGTRIIFAYVLFLGVYWEGIYPDTFVNIRKWIEMLTMYGYNPLIKEFGPQEEYTILQSVSDKQLLHPSMSGLMFPSVLITTQYKTPWVKGFVFNTAGLTNYRGIVNRDGIVHRDSKILYR